MLLVFILPTLLRGSNTLAVALVGPYGLAGIAVAIAIAAWIEAIALLVRRRAPHLTARRAQATISLASYPAFTVPSPTSPSNVTPAAANSMKSLSTIPFSITGAPASTFTPPGRKLV